MLSVVWLFHTTGIVFSYNWYVISIQHLRNLFLQMKHICDKMIEIERFIATLSQEDFDYTRWQRERFDDVPADDFFDAAVRYEKENPF